MMKFYIHISPTTDPYRNLAADEIFLDTLSEDQVLLYFYVNRSSVILGRNQNPYRECALDAMARDGVSLVRRMTGGGAVYHDEGNLNFSFHTPADRYHPDEQDELLLAALRALGISAEKNGRNDFVLPVSNTEVRKFSGNAFGGRKSRRVRHGTLLVDADFTKLTRYLTVHPEKLRAKGVTSVRSRVCNLREVCPALTVDALRDELILQAEAVFGPAGAFSANSAFSSAVDTLSRERQAFPWLYGESPAFDYGFTARFSFGTAELCVRVADGLIRQVNLYTDALDVTLSERVRAVLTDLPFSPGGMAEALLRTEHPALGEIGAYMAKSGE